MSLLPGNESEHLKIFDEIFEKSTTADVSGITILPQDARAQILPYLAHMFDVDISGLSPSEQRSLIQNAIEIHRYEGTLYAVKKALLSVFSQAEIVEWFDVEGDPYTFDAKVTIGTSLVQVFDAKKFEKCRELINMAKNERSHFLNFYVELPKSKGLIGCDTGLNWKTETKGGTALSKKSDCEIGFQSGAAFIDGSKMSCSLSKGSLCELQLRSGSTYRFDAKASCSIARESALQINTIGGITWQI